MKKITLKFLKNIIFLIAVLSAYSPSQIGMYQPECPKKLKEIINKNK